MRTIKVSTPGKIHFLGEHAVVYGKPALLTAVDKRCVISMSSRQDKQIFVFSKNINKNISMSVSDVISKTKVASLKYKKYVQTNDITLLKSLTRNELDYPLLAIGEALNYYKEQNISSGFEIIIDSEIPIGGGLGSSAALAVAISGAITLYLNKPFDKDTINAIAFLTEQIKHGLPSGGDNSTVCYGGLVWFRKESPELKIIQPVPFTIPNKLAQRFSFINTGQPSESTGEMVSLVRDLFNNNPKKGDAFLENQEKLTRELLTILKNCDENKLIPTIREGERNLEIIGVVSNYSKTIIREIEKVGGAAKICGAGGKTKGTGILLVYHHDNQKIQEIAKSRNLYFFKTQLGVEGVKQI